jgi:ribosomal protein S18 acetylase RimI-like enzyme
MLTVSNATLDDVDELVELESRLFAEDAGRYERFADITWPQREGRADFLQLIAADSCLVLIAKADGVAVGFLAGYQGTSSPTRLPHTYAELRSLYVNAERRGQGAGSALTERFLAWARAAGCDEAHVDSYADNHGAQRFYERHGFVARSVSRAMSLTSTATTAWMVVRQDIHGSRFDVKQFATQIEAAALVEEYESGYPHHQTYFIERR